MEQPIIVKARTRRTQQQISDLLAEFDKADCTVKEFCELKGINQGNFHKWKSRRKEIGVQRSRPSAFTKVLVRSSSSDHLFAEVNGVRFYQPVSAAYLKELIG
jgi:hypothetical protein